MNIGNITINKNSISEVTHHLVAGNINFVAWCRDLLLQQMVILQCLQYDDGTDILREHV